MRKNKVKTGKQSITMEVDGKEYGAIQKGKTVYRKNGLVKKTVTKIKGTPGSVIGRSKEVKRYR
jgi:hypothetical protein